eukprot:762611-Hanusia_phi.AAC.2
MRTYRNKNDRGYRDVDWNQIKILVMLTQGYGSAAKNHPQDGAFTIAVILFQPPPPAAAAAVGSLLSPAPSPHFTSPLAVIIAVASRLLPVVVPPDSPPSSQPFLQPPTLSHENFQIFGVTFKTNSKCVFGSPQKPSSLPGNPGLPGCVPTCDSHGDGQGPQALHARRRVPAASSDCSVPPRTQPGPAAAQAAGLPVCGSVTSHGAAACHAGSESHMQCHDVRTTRRDDVMKSFGSSVAIMLAESDQNCYCANR